MISQIERSSGVLCLVKEGPELPVVRQFESAVVSWWAR